MCFAWISEQTAIISLCSVNLCTHDTADRQNRRCIMPQTVNTV